VHHFDTVENGPEKERARKAKLSREKGSRS